MADVVFELYGVDDGKINIEKIKAFELTRETDAASDGLRLWFTSDRATDEVYRVRMSVDGRVVFNGYADAQRELVGSNGLEGFVYARSSACILTDIEAMPDSFYHPCSQAVYDKYISNYGFSYGLDDLFYDGQYTVGKGCSLFGALDGFVFGVTGKHIYVNASDEIRLLESNKTVKLSGDIISEKRIINRGDLLCGIDYKLSSDENYVHHRESELMKKRGVKARIMKNLSALTPLQRENALSTAMARANDGYIGFEIDVCGIFPAELCDKIEYESVVFDTSEEMRLRGISYAFDSKGYHTRLRLAVINDLEELSYVDE